MSAYSVSVRDVGPIISGSMDLEPGVTIAAGPHGVGKSTFIAAVAGLGGRDPKELELSVRDGAKVGVVSGLGTTISITAHRTQVAGECELESAEERFDISDVAEHKVKKPAAQLTRRIKGLLSMTGRKLELSDFETILPENLRDKLNSDDRDDDPVEFAGKVKRRMEKLKRDAEGDADKKAGEAAALFAQIKDLNLEAPHDADKLNAAVEAAVVAKSQLTERAKNAAASVASIANAKQRLADLEESLGEAAATIDERLTEANAAFGSAAAAHQAAADKVKELERALDVAKAELRAADQAHASASETVSDLNAEAKRLAEQRKELDTVRQAAAGSAIAPPSEDDIAAAADELAAARAAAELGAKVRDGLKAKEKMEAARAEQSRFLGLANVYRSAAAATNDVLSNAVNCRYLKVIEGDLCYVNGDGAPESFARLSDGERWRASILEAAYALKQSGRPAILTIPQTAWEGLNTTSRDTVDAVAKECGVCIVSGEVTDDDAAGFDYYRWDERK